MIYLYASILENVDHSPSLIQVRGCKRNPEFDRIQRNAFYPALPTRVKALDFTSSLPIARLFRQFIDEFWQDDGLDVLPIRCCGEAWSIQVFLAKT